MKTAVQGNPDEVTTAPSGSLTSPKIDTLEGHVLDLATRLFHYYGPRDYALRLWGQTTFAPELPGPPRFTLHLKYPDSLRRMFLPPTMLSAGESYLRDEWEVEGDLIAAMALYDSIADRRRPTRKWMKIVKDLLALPHSEKGSESATRRAALQGRRHSRERDMRAIAYHYDISNDFYALWLDSNMAYSCAYFHSGKETLDEAQLAKFDYICRKLRLKAGERLLDIGCGWGGLILYAAKHYGVQATGITLSREQAELTSTQIESRGLADRCRVRICDYRDIASESFDKVVSVGMFEHVGKARLAQYFRVAYTMLKPGGLFLNHGISDGNYGKINPLLQLYINRSENFISRYVFPDGELAPIDLTLSLAGRAGFEVRDLESLREHYALTLRHWTRRLESHRTEAVKTVGEMTYRIWRLYMAGCAYGFIKGYTNLYQSLLAKPHNGRVSLPLTRADLY